MPEKSIPIKTIAKYANEYYGNGHTCQQIVLACIDFRFNHNVTKTLKEQGIDKYDLISLPGASKAAIEEKYRLALFDSLEICIAKHHATKLLIIDHIDCGAYGGSGLFSNREEEMDFHLEKLIEARKIIQKKFSALSIELLYLDWNSLVMLKS